MYESKSSMGHLAVRSILCLVIILVFIDIARGPLGRIFSFPEPKISKEYILKVPIFEARPGHLIQSTIETFGTVRGLRSMKIKFPERGRLVEVAKGEVKKGDVVARLDSGELDGAVRAARGTLEKALRQAISAKMRVRMLGKGIDDAQALNAQSDAKRAAGELERAIGARSKFVIYAPFTGHNGALKYQAGDVVSGDTITIFSETFNPRKEDMTALVQLNQMEIEHAVIGKKVVLTMPDDSRCTGVIKQVDRGVNEFGFFNVEITFKKSQHSVPILADAVVKVEIKRNECREQNTYVVLKSAIAMPTDYDRQPGVRRPMFLFVVKSDRAIRTKIEVLATSGKYCKVLSPKPIKSYIADAAVAADGAKVINDSNPIYVDNFKPQKEGKVWTVNPNSKAELLQRLEDEKNSIEASKVMIAEIQARLYRIEEESKPTSQVDSPDKESLDEGMPREEELLSRYKGESK